MSRVEGILQAVAEQVEGEHGEQQRKPGEQHVPPRGVEDRSGVGEHLPPAGRGRAHADAEERERRLEQDVGRDQQAGVDDQRRREVGEDLAEDDARVGCPQRAGGVDELPLAQREHLAAHDPHDVGPVEQRDDRDDRGDARLDRPFDAAAHAARGPQPEADEQHREAQHHVGEAREQRVGEPR